MHQLGPPPQAWRRFSDPVFEARQQLGWELPKEKEAFILCPDRVHVDTSQVTGVGEPPCNQQCAVDCTLVHIQGVAPTHPR